MQGLGTTLTVDSCKQQQKSNYLEPGSVDVVAALYAGFGRQHDLGALDRDQVSRPVLILVVLLPVEQLRSHEIVFAGIYYI